MSLIEDKIVFRGIQFDYLPDVFQDALQAPVGVRHEVIPLVDGDVMQVVLTPKSRADNVGYEKRRYRRQVFRLGWQESFMDRCMRDYLRQLYDTQTPFWIQFDDEMSRCVATLHSPDREFKHYFTPTFPIAPYGYTPDAPIGYESTIYVNGIPIASGYEVDSDSGMVRFASSLTEDDVVTMKYTWRMYARIIEWSLTPVDAIAQNAYQGEIVIQQLVPDYSYDPWQVSLTCACCGEDGVGETTASIPSGMSVPSIPWWSVPSNWTGWSGVGVDTFCTHGNVYTNHPTYPWMLTCVCPSGGSCVNTCYNTGYLSNGSCYSCGNMFLSNNSCYTCGVDAQFSGQSCFCLSGGLVTQWSNGVALCQTGAASGA